MRIAIAPSRLAHRFRLVLVTALALATAIGPSAFAQGLTLVPDEDPYPVRRVVNAPPAVVLGEKGLDGGVEEIARRFAEHAPAVAHGVGLAEPRPVAVYVLRGSTFRRWARGLIPEWGAGYANWPDGPIALDLDAITGGTKPLDMVLRHEISHVYLGQSLQGVRPPTWFVEGVAQLQSGEWGFSDTFALVQVASVGALPPLSSLAGRFPAGGIAAENAYRLSLLAVQDLDQRLDDRGGWKALVEAARDRGRFDLAFEDLVGLRLPAYELELESRLRMRYGWIAAIAGASTLFFVMSLLFVAGAGRAYVRKHRRLRQMAEEERDLPSEGPWNENEGPAADR